MKRGLNRSDIIFTMQKICQVFQCPFSCVCLFVSFLGLRLFSHFPLLSLLGLVRSALGSSPIEQRWQEKIMDAYRSVADSEVWHKQSRWLDIYTFLCISPVAVRLAYYLTKPVTACCRAQGWHLLALEQIVICERVCASLCF